MEKPRLAMASIIAYEVVFAIFAIAKNLNARCASRSSTIDQLWTYWITSKRNLEIIEPIFSEFLRRYVTMQVSMDS